MNDKIRLTRDLGLRFAYTRVEGGMAKCIAIYYAPRWPDCESIEVQNARGLREIAAFLEAKAAELELLEKEAAHEPDTDDQR